MIKINTVKPQPLYGTCVKVECEVTQGIGIHLVGLADAAVKESLLRTITAMQANAYRIPGKKIVINLAPADLQKRGTGYDLPIALAVIAASGQEPLSGLDGWLAFGELALDGTLRAVPGVFQAIAVAREYGLKAVIPAACATEAAYYLQGEGQPVYLAENLLGAIAVIEHPEGHVPVGKLDIPVAQPPVDADPFQGLTPSERRTAEIAAAGGHGILATGSDERAAYLSRAVTRLLPSPLHREWVERCAVRSLAGMFSAERVPLRIASATSSLAALIGGGSGVLPGEVSLAHGGVLCLREADMAPKSVFEALRGPMEDGCVRISWLRGVVKYPARFLPVISLGCAKVNALPAPVYDRLDLQDTLCDAAPSGEDGEAFEVVYERVTRARKMQRERYGEGVTNASAAFNLVENEMEPACKELLDKLVTRLGLSARSYSRIVRIARTIADLEGSETIKPVHLAEATPFRFLDRIPDEEA